jgi:hypothetical protein
MKRARRNCRWRIAHKFYIVMVEVTRPALGGQARYAVKNYSTCSFCIFARA